MASNVTRDHHNLRRNLKLNGNYISNDGGDEGITISDAGVVTASSQLDIGNMSLTTSELDISSGDFTLDVAGTPILDSGTGMFHYRYAGDTNDYFRIQVAASGVTKLTTHDSDGQLGIYIFNQMAGQL
jgi:hypothetical protein